MSWKLERGNELFREGSELAKTVLERVRDSGISSKEDAANLGSSVELLRSAMNWLEDSDGFEDAHRALDAVGRVRRKFFPTSCELPYEQGTYQQKCPVALAHSRTGISVGAIIEESECSICGEDPDNCLHITGREYDTVRCVTIIKRARLEHAALVARPDFPDARVMAMPMPMDYIRSELGESFVPGTTLYCDRCLSDCDGVGDPMATAEQKSAHDDSTV